MSTYGTFSAPHRLPACPRPQNDRHPGTPLAPDRTARAHGRHRHRRHQGDGGRRRRRRQHPGEAAHGDPGQVQEPQGRRGHHRRTGARPVRPARRARRRHRRGRLGRRRPQPGALHPPCRGANEPLRDRIADRLAVPVLVDNDANTAAWAEWRFGAGRGEDQPGHDHPRYRHRRRDPGGRPGQAGQVRGGRRVRPYAGGARRPPLPVRQPGLLGAVQLRERAGPRGPGAGRRRLPGGVRDHRARQGADRRHRRPDDHRAGPRR
ncbi:hypothetical protein SGLAM104S_08088 [Streptomyces glaucescens]